MIKTFTVFKKIPFYSLFFLMFSASMVDAEIFKWVDGNGRIHYSDSKDNVGNSIVEELKISSPNLTMNYASDLVQTMKNEKGRSRLDSAQKPFQHNKSARSFEIAKAGWGGHGPETDKKRCALARAVLNGSARHTNGTPTDAHDKKVAQRDLRKFCH
jgi:hypothetical protein